MNWRQFLIGAGVGAGWGLLMSFMLPFPISVVFSVVGGFAIGWYLLDFIEGIK